MKVKTFLLILITLALLLGGMGCEKNNEIPSELLGSWKLMGFGNTADNSLKEVEPKDCDKCFTLTFKRDKTFYGKSVMNLLEGRYAVSGSNISLSVGGTKIGEITGDGGKFIETLSQADRFTIHNSNLYLYFSEKEFLSLKKIN